MNKVVHFEIPVKDEEKAQKFYSEIFGWKIVPVPYDGGNYLIAQTAKTDENGMIEDKPGSINGALIPRNETDKQIILVIGVESIDDKIKEVEASGGKMVQPKTKVMEMGLYAKVLDPDGNLLGLWENLMPDT